LPCPSSSPATFFLLPAYQAERTLSLSLSRLPIEYFTAAATTDSPQFSTKNITTRVVGVFQTKLMRLQIFFSKTLSLCKFLQTISDTNEIQIWGFFFLASGGGPKGKKGQPHLLPWIFQNGSLSSSSSASLTPLSLAAAHPKIMQ